MRQSALWLFLIGLGSQTQFHFIGSIGISEIVIFVVAPIIFIRDYTLLRKEGYLPILWLSILVCVCCCISSKINATPFVLFIKGLAHPYAIFSAIVVLARFLRRDPGAFFWFVIGAFLSGIICIFVFQKETFTMQGGEIMTGSAAVAAVMGYALFWSSKIRALLSLPIMIKYLSVPMLYSVVALLASGVISLVYSEGSGRAAALTSVLSMLLIVMGGKTRARIARFGRNLLWFCVVCLMLAFVLRVTYSFVAKNGYLGEAAQSKYLRQTRAGDNALSIIMSGRMELFCGIMACLDRPIFAFGPKGEDTGGYVEDYLSKYGVQEDYEGYVKTVQARKARGQYVYYTIPAHSHLAMFWIYYGIIGLIFWLYVIWLIYEYFRKYAAAVPQWYGYMCISASIFMWDVFFSPFDNRIGTPLMICCIIISKAVATNRKKLPEYMEAEILRCH